MKILIIEDESAASSRLIRMLKQIDPSIGVDAVLESVEDTIQWLTDQAPPELILADIQLSDGSCFEIFRRITVESPVIFVTAFDEFAIDAFKVNSIDYLLKPIDPTELSRAIEKYERLKSVFAPKEPARLESLLKQMESGKPPFKNRFLVKSGSAWHSIPTDQIRYLVIEDQLVFLVTAAHKRFVVDNILDDLENQLDPEQFFRINRQMIVSLTAIQSIFPYFNNRLKLLLDPPLEQEVLVSRPKVHAFKQWLDT